MMCRAPIPPFPTIRVWVYTGKTEQVTKAQQGLQIITNVSPLVMGAAGDSHGPRAVLRLLAHDFATYDIKRLIPAYGHIFRLAPILDIALTIWVEILTF